MNDKQRRFCEEYLVDLNATQAAIRAGYSARTAKLTGHRVITNDNCKEYIAQLKLERSEVTGIDANWVLQESVKLYKMCLDDDDLRTAKGCLELAGKHVDVQAFKSVQDINVNDERTMSETERMSRVARLLNGVHSGASREDIH